MRKRQLQLATRVDELRGAYLHGSLVVDIDAAALRRGRCRGVAIDAHAVAELLMAQPDLLADAPAADACVDGLVRPAVEAA